jgi:hypothetical protein
MNIHISSLTKSTVGTLIIGRKVGAPVLISWDQRLFWFLGNQKNVFISWESTVQLFSFLGNLQLFSFLGNQRLFWNLGYQRLFFISWDSTTILDSNQFQEPNTVGKGRNFLKKYFNLYWVQLIKYEIYADLYCPCYKKIWFLFMRTCCSSKIIDKLW